MFSSRKRQSVQTTQGVVAASASAAVARARVCVCVCVCVWEGGGTGGCERTLSRDDDHARGAPQAFDAAAAAPSSAAVPLAQSAGRRRDRVEQARGLRGGRRRRLGWRRQQQRLAPVSLVRAEAGAHGRRGQLGRAGRRVEPRRAGRELRRQPHGRVPLPMRLRARRCVRLPRPRTRVGAGADVRQDARVRGLPFDVLAVVQLAADGADHPAAVDEVQGERERRKGGRRARSRSGQKKRAKLTFCQHPSKQQKQLPRSSPATSTAPPRAGGTSSKASASRDRKGSAASARRSRC
jgi:hypothetical protein